MRDVLLYHKPEMSNSYFTDDISPKAMIETRRVIPHNLGVLFKYPTNTINSICEVFVVDEFPFFKQLF